MSGDGVSLLPNNANVGGAQQGLSMLRGQDAWIKIDPLRSLFSQTIARVSNFVQADYDQITAGGQGPIGSAWSNPSSITVVLPKVGDICTDVKLNFLLVGFKQPLFTAAATSAITPQASSYVWTPAIGWAILATNANSMMQIGGADFEQISDIHCIVQDECFTPAHKRAGLSVGDYAPALRFANRSTAAANAQVPVGSGQIGGVSEARAFSARTRNIVVGLPLYFTKDVMNGVNIVGLQQQDVTFRIGLRSRAQCAISCVSNDDTGAITLLAAGSTTNGIDTDVAYSTGFGQIADFKIQFRFSYLDGPERQFFAQAPMTKLYQPVYMMAQQVVGQTISGNQTSASLLSNVLLKFNQPTTATLFAYRSAVAESQNEWCRFGGYSGVKAVDSTSGLLIPQEVVDPISSIQFQLNSNPLYNATTDYLRQYNSTRHGGGVPKRMVSMWAYGTEPANTTKLTGSLNFSAIDSAIWNFTFRPVAVAPAAGATVASELSGYTDLLTSSFSAVPVLQSNTPQGNVFLLNSQINIQRQGGGAIGSLYGS